MERKHIYSELKFLVQKFEANKYHYLSKNHLEEEVRDATEKATHDKIVELVDKMLELNKKKNTLPTSSKREQIEREIQITNENIDDLVYELYEITDEERKIIEIEKND